MASRNLFTPVIARAAGSTTARQCRALGFIPGGAAVSFSTRSVAVGSARSISGRRPLAAAAASVWGKATATGRLAFAPRRWESSSAGGGETKIWDFEQLCEFTSAAATDKSRPRGVTIIDVREPHELSATGRIPGAINVPVKSSPDSWHVSDDEFEQRHDFARPARDAEVLFYCKAGVRSRAAAGLAADAGWTKVGEYPGSWDDWVSKGGKVER